MKSRIIEFFFSSTIILLFSALAMSAPQTHLLNKACNEYNVPDTSTFLANLNNAVFDLQTQINGSARFAMAQSFHVSNPVYALFQCRDYLSLPDCLSCLSTALSQIQSCSNVSAAGARVIYDGCFLRYEGLNFFAETAFFRGSIVICGNETTVRRKDELLEGLSVATPRMEGYFAAARSGESGNVVYGIAQCIHTMTEVGCRDCLKMAYESMGTCPNYGRVADAGCFLRYSDTEFFSDNFTADLVPFLRTRSSSTNATVIGGVAGGVGFLLLLGVLFFLLHWRSKKRKKSREGDIQVIAELRGPMNFKYKDLKSATKKFSKENKLGEGGFGDVYKAVLRNGKTVAVKKLMISQSSRAKASFEAEVKLISNVRHRNLVRLLGCCGKGPELLLVYEYMANSSLDKFLFGHRQGTLNWKQRFDIMVGTARGLAYLHEEFHVCIIHRDIKSSNILLDDDFQARIADFGLVRLLPEDKSHLSTKFAGTLGYTAPEYAVLGQLSEKVDTYSYGIVLLEIISGRRSTDMHLEPVAEYLLEWAWRLYESDMLMDLVDATLELDEQEKNEVKRTMEIALSCTQSVVASRPTMSEVVVLLLSEDQVVLRPSRPAFIDATNRAQGGTSTSTGSSTSNATMSISKISGR